MRAEGLGADPPSTRHRPPAARRGDQVDVLHGEEIADPYRWLENTDSAETRAWVAAENELTQAWLAAVPEREEIRTRLTELWDYPRTRTPFERGGRWFVLRNHGLQNQDVLYVMDGPEDAGRILLDPNERSAEGTESLTAFSVSEDGELLAYAISAAGSDWMTWRVRETRTGQDREDLLDWSKFSGAAWLKDGSGFLYGAMDPPSEGSELLESATAQKVVLHRIGTPQSADVIIYEDPEHPEWVNDGTVSEDGRFLIVTVSRGTEPEAQVHVLDRQAPDAGFRPLVGEFASKASYVTNVGTTFYLLTDDGAERGRVVAVELDRPARAAWREVIPESTALLLAVRRWADGLICHRLADACSELAVFGLDGTPRHHVPVPAVSSLGSDHSGAGFEVRPDGRLLHFVVTSFTESGSLWEHDLETARTRRLRASSAQIDAGGLISERRMIRTDDGTALALFLTRRADVEPNGEVPVLLYGYGGFDISITPSFDVGWAAFIERGGLLAVAVLRGGGEYGRSWHRAGILATKQRVFDDFCDCARWLHTSGWSRPGRIAINGASNGGLLVGACVTQRPELFGAAVADVGVLDMLRFHRFTIGWAWKSDFGDPEDPHEYPALRAYSPLHNVVAGRRYPPILITTGDHDDRVVPGHSFKFAATLQAAAELVDDPDPSPVLLRTETAAGHGHGLPTAKAIALTTDTLAFITAALGHSDAVPAAPV